MKELYESLLGAWSGIAAILDLMCWYVWTVMASLFIVIFGKEECRAEMFNLLFGNKKSEWTFDMGALYGLAGILVLMIFCTIFFLIINFFPWLTYPLRYILILYVIHKLYLFSRWLINQNGYAEEG